MKLSIIIPFYNAEPYMSELMKVLLPQLTGEVEVIVVDDGSKVPYEAPEGVKVIRQKNKGLAGARNTGLKHATGKYIAFIDADDLVSENFVEYILSRADEEWDYMDLSWKSLEDNRHVYKLNSDSDRLTNPSVCTKVWNRDFIGNLKFNEKKDVAEDEDFTRRIDLSRGKRICAPFFMYYYRIGTPNSLSKKYRKGRTKTKRILYYFEHITMEMAWLIDEIKKEFETNEVIVMTNKNELPELEKYAAIIKPMRTYAHELRGEECKFVEVVENLKTQIVLYMEKPSNFGGRETFIYNFCRQMSKHYDIIVVFEKPCIELQIKLTPYVQVFKNDQKTSILCDTLILNSVYDQIPENIIFKQSIQMVHGCQASTARSVPTDKGQIVCVSETVKESFGENCKDAIVIRNLTSGNKPTRKRPNGMRLITASRLNTDPRYEDKGAKRMIQLANMLHNAGIEFEWNYYADSPISNVPKEMSYHKPTSDIQEKIAESTYLVQLSGAEAFCYSVVEALEIGVPVIVTPLPVFDELKIKDGENAYIVPFNMNFDVEKLKNIPEFKYKYNNGTLVSKWKKLLGNTIPTHSYVPEELVNVRILVRYEDIEMNHKVVNPGEVYPMRKERALRVEERGYGKIIGG